MNTCKCWASVLIVVLLLPNVAASADAAMEAYEKGAACLRKRTTMQRLLRLPRPSG